MLSKLRYIADIANNKKNKDNSNKVNNKKKENSDKFVYFFGKGKSEGNAKMADILGGKGAGLAEMTNIGIPVPAGFTISTKICEFFYKNKKKYPKSLKKEVNDNLEKLEKITNKKFGDKINPLLVSVRSGAPVSMPGMMDTILNLGMNDDTVLGLAKRTQNECFAYDTYRRFIQMFGNVVYNIPIDEFENSIRNFIRKKKKERNKDVSDTKLNVCKQKKNTKDNGENIENNRQFEILGMQLSSNNLEEIVKIYKNIYKKHTKEDFPQDPKVQLWTAIDAVFGSWTNDRAVKYREFNNIKNIRGTAVNVQSMVFGNYGNNSGTGVCFSRNPVTGVKEIYGEYLQNAQGEDVVAGIRTPMKIDFLKKKYPVLYKKLESTVNKLEKHYRDMQDIEFTVCDNELFLLQTRTGKRNGQSAIRCAVDMVNEKMITKEEAITRITQKDMEQLLYPMIDENDKKDKKSIAIGLNASFGAGCGEIVCSSKEAEEKVKNGKKVILVRQNTSPEDISGMIVSEGILTSTGGATSHAAIVSRGIGTPCVICAGAISFSGNNVIINGKSFKKGDFITIDGTTGEVFEGKMKLVNNTFNDYAKTFLKWCDDISYKSVRDIIVKNEAIIENEVITENNELLEVNKTAGIDNKITEDKNKKTALLNGKKIISTENKDKFIFHREEVAKNDNSKFPVVATAAIIHLKGFDVYANADQPNDVRKAIEFGAKGIGLCRTEHMFFDKKKLMSFRAMILSDTKELRNKYLKQILPLQQKDFEDIFTILDGKSIIIRLLDPPLHEFAPKTKEENESLAKFMNCSVKQLEQKASLLKETNPMMGHRGCRLAITYPEIYEMQVEAICNAIINCTTKKNIKTQAKIMIPIVCDNNELYFVRSICEKKIEAVFSKYIMASSQRLSKKTLALLNKTKNSTVATITCNNNDYYCDNNDNAIISICCQHSDSKFNANYDVKTNKITIPIGTMIETPRAVILADKIANYADFFSFGTNDLTQTTFAFSRDDVNKLLLSYFDKNIFVNHLFKSLDKDGVGQLMKLAVQKGRSAKQMLHIGICGEHGGDPKTIDFCYKIGLNYVSCSPFKIPVAKLSVAQAVINASKHNFIK